MNFFSIFAIYSTFLTDLVIPAHAQSSIEPLENLFDECLAVIARTENAELLVEERVTDFGTVTVGTNGSSCTIMGYSETLDSYEVAGNSLAFIDRFASWMRSRESDFVRPQIIHAEGKRAILAVCRDDAWQVIALSSTIESIATEAMRNDPRWLPNLGQVATAVFLGDGPRGNTCSTNG
ncbi:hypothetical protein GQR58_030675 [Nymphon striatum]|nr:hypothetical protein GQR58_030675 [Nymphon striatum]